MIQLKPDDIMFVYSDDFESDGGVFLLAVGEASDRAINAHIHHCGKFYAPNTSRKFLTGDRAAWNFVRKYERENRWPKFAVRYHWRWIEELTAPCYIDKGELIEIYAVADRAIKSGTTNNLSLAKIVRDAAKARWEEPVPYQGGEK